MTQASVPPPVRSMTEEVEGEDPHDRPYRREDFRNVRYRPMSSIERLTRRLIAAAIVTALMILIAFIAQARG